MALLAQLPIKLQMWWVPKDVEADRPVGVDVGMVDPRCEGYLQGIVVDCLEQNFEKETLFALTFGGLKG